jgi:hypothetical protein
MGLRDLGDGLPALEGAAQRFGVDADGGRRRVEAATRTPPGAAEPVRAARRPSGFEGGRDHAVRTRSAISIQSFKKREPMTRVSLRVTKPRRANGSRYARPA